MHINDKTAPPGPGGARAVGRVVWRAASAGVLVWALIAGWPQLRTAADVLQSADRRLLLVALGCQLAAIGLLAFGYRASLRAAGAVLPLRAAGGIAVRAGAVSRLLPGGGGAAALFAIRRLRRAGVADGPAAAGVALNGLLTMGILVAVVAVAGGSRPGAAVVAAGVAAVTVAGVTARRAESRPRMNRIADRLRLRPSLSVFADALDTVVVGDVRGRDLAAAAAGVTAAWVCELTALWFAVAAVGHPLPLAAIALGLGAANAAAAFPHTPGGVGVVEVAMTAAFVAAGVDAGVALGGVLAYRIVGFWMPVVAGAGLLAADTVGGWSFRPRKAAVMAQ